MFVFGATNQAIVGFGFAVAPDGTAAITLAHSNHDGLFRDGAFVPVIASGQNAPCWMTRFDKYLFTANTASKTISRLIGTGNNLFVDDAVAATIPTGGAPTDLDAADNLLAVIDGAAGVVAHNSVRLGRVRRVVRSTIGDGRPERERRCGRDGGEGR